MSDDAKVQRSPSKQLYGVAEPGSQPVLSMSSPTLSWGQKPGAPKWRSNSLIPGFFPKIMCRPPQNLIRKDNILAWWELPPEGRQDADRADRGQQSGPAGEDCGVIQTPPLGAAPATGCAHPLSSPVPREAWSPLPEHSSKTMFCNQNKKRRKHLPKYRLRVWRLTGKAPILKSSASEWLHDAAHYKIALSHSAFKQISCVSVAWWDDKVNHSVM